MPDSILSHVSTPELVATLCFAIALLQTFLGKAIQSMAQRYPNESVTHVLLHFAAETEIVFGFWGAIYVFFMIFDLGHHDAMTWLDSRNFSEAVFVFGIMVLAATKPITTFVGAIVERVAALIPIHRSLALYFSVLVVAPLLGSFITEPAAMTLAAIILREKILNHGHKRAVIYGTMAVLFVNVSIGGTLTSFAAPPVLMVARVWDWDTAFMLKTFGWRTVLAVITNAALFTFYYRESISKVPVVKVRPKFNKNTIWITIVHFMFMAATVMSAHHPAFIAGAVFLFFGFSEATQFAQSKLKVREGLLVAFFLGGLVILTAEQGWWIRPVIESLEEFQLFASAAALTAITDNAALTSLAAQVPTITDASKHAIVAGAVVGGGLTIIANAPNPAGFAIMKDLFPGGTLNAPRLFVAAIVPTLIAGFFLWL